MNVYEPGQRRRNKARERYMVRQHKRGGMANSPSWRDKLPRVSMPGANAEWGQRAAIFVRDLLWYLTHSTTILLGLVAAALVIFLAYTGGHVMGARIFPNVYAAGIHLGDMTVEEATAALTNAWENTIRIQLVDGDRTWTAQPADLGMQIDAQQTAESARHVGLAGIPMGWGIAPVVSVDFTTAQNYLLDLTGETDMPPYNAGFQWQGDQLVGVPGVAGRMLDVARVMDTLTKNPVQVIEARRLDLLMSSIPPENDDPDAALADARQIAGSPFMLYGYDPFKDETVSWSTSREVFASWLEASSSGLTLRDDAYSAFLEAQNQSLNPDGQGTRYLDPVETKDRIRQAITRKQRDVQLRIRYRPTTYTIVSGDTGFRIGRKTGIPFFLIQQANPGRDWNKNLSIGEVINLPSRDATLPLDPLPNKRIVVNLNTQTLVAFENGQPVFSWLISSGLDDYPTSPGIYQILNHDDIASGSSYTLCNTNASCGQWEMYWFMGIYEVTPGLMNGFHGAVLLPNGAYLGGGNVGSPYTFGCVMSRDDQGKLLYDWADDGTMVEILSSEFAPQSELGRLTLTQSFPLQA